MPASGHRLRGESVGTLLIRARSLPWLIRRAAAVPVQRRPRRRPGRGGQGRTRGACRGRPGARGVPRQPAEDGPAGARRRSAWRSPQALRRTSRRCPIPGADQTREDVLGSTATCSPRNGQRSSPSATRPDRGRSRAGHAGAAGSAGGRCRPPGEPAPSCRRSRLRNPAYNWTRCNWTHCGQVAAVPAAAAGVPETPSGRYLVEALLKT